MPLEPLADRGFGSRAEAYEQARPGWPSEVVEELVRELGVSLESTVVDLAAGTGKLTRQLVERAGRVIAVEPSAAMRNKLAAIVEAADPLDGTADAMPLPDASADAVFIAEAFHWFATGEAVTEIARVLRPGGGLALLWNVHAWHGDEPSLAEVGKLVAARRASGETREDRLHSGRWRQAFEGSAGELFEPFHEIEVEHRQVVDLEGLLLHMSTWSFISALDDGERESLLAEARAVLERELPDPDRIVIPYRTVAHWTRRRAGWR